MIVFFFPPIDIMPDDYCVITKMRERLQFEGFILSRGVPYLPCTLSLSKKLKEKFAVELFSICEVNLSDFDKKVGDGDILSIVESPKELRQLVRANLLPEESEYSYLCKSHANEEDGDETAEGDDQHVSGGGRAPKGKREAANAQKASRGQTGKKGSGLSPQAGPSVSPTLNFQLQKLDEQMGDCTLSDL